MVMGWGHHSKNSVSWAMKEKAPEGGRAARRRRRAKMASCQIDLLRQRLLAGCQVMSGVQVQASDEVAASSDVQIRPRACL